MPKRFFAPSALGLALTLPLLAAISPASAAVKASDVIGAAVNDFVRPAYASLHDRASELTKAMQALCAAPSPANLDTARAGFSDAVDAWSTVEIITFGPIRQDNRLERMLFWPDRKGIGLKQVQAALAEKDATATDAAQLAKKSVAMQGFGALEFVLYGTGAEALVTKDDAYRCAYGAAIAGNIKTMAGDVVADWSKKGGFADLWTNPGPDNPLYRDGNEAVTELMGVFVNGLEMVRDVRLKGFFGATPDTDKPRQAIYRRSQNTAASLAANLEGMDRLFTVSHVGDALSPEARWMADSTHILLANGAADARAVTGPIDEALTDPARRAKLDHFALVTSTLSSLIGTRMTAEFGLTAGFSSLDGD